MKFYFECRDEEEGVYLTALNPAKAFFTMLFGRGYATFVPWWKVRKEG